MFFYVAPSGRSLCLPQIDPSMVRYRLFAFLVLVALAKAAAASGPIILSTQSVDDEGKSWVLEVLDDRESGPQLVLAQRSRTERVASVFWSREVDTVTRTYIKYWRAAFAVNPGGESAWVAYLRSTSGTLAIDLDLAVRSGPCTESRRIEISRISPGVCLPELFSLVAAGDESLIGLRCGGPTRWIGYSEREHDWFQLGPERRRVAGRDGSGKLVDGWPIDDGVPVDPGSDWPSPKIAITAPAQAVVYDPKFSKITLSYDDQYDSIDLSSLQVGIDGVSLPCTIGASEITCAVPKLREGFYTLSAEVRSRSDFWANTAFDFIYRPDADPPRLLIDSPKPGVVFGLGHGVSFELSDAVAGIDLQSFRFLVDGVDMTPNCSVNYESATCLPGIAPGPHRLMGLVRDRAGILATAAVDVEFQDGEGTP